MTGAPVILCCGEAVIDMIPARLGDGAQGFRAVPGGAAVNTAVALARQQVPAGFVGALSGDAMGRRLADHLRSEAVGMELVQDSARPTTLALATPVAGGTRFTLYDEGSAGRFFQPPELPGSARALVFGGISLIHPPAANSFETLANRAAPDHLIWLDLNIRPALVNDRATYTDRLHRMMRLADVIKVSDEDLDWLGLESALALRPAAPDALLIHTRGANGAVAWRGTGNAFAPAPATEVHDTIGAGDIFNAGFLAHIYRAGALGKPLAGVHDWLEPALCAGVLAASLSVARPGADPPSLKEIACAP